MFRMKILKVFELCSMFEDNCPCKPVYDAKLNITSGERRYIMAIMSDFHQIQQQCIDRLYHSGVNVPCGEGAFCILCYGLRIGGYGGHNHGSMQRCA